MIFLKASSHFLLDLVDLLVEFHSELLFHLHMHSQRNLAMHCVVPNLRNAFSADTIKHSNPAWGGPPVAAPNEISFFTGVFKTTLLVHIQS
ncbi:hypothetical protein KC342_g44 [Hortaea werneckii]|nr:hypothetical protein KC342_g44 [Hortaea werneckii]